MREVMNTSEPVPLAPEVAVNMVRREAQLYSQLESYAVRQRALIALDDQDPLLALLARRQQLVVELMDIGRKLAPMRRQGAAHRANLTSTQRAEFDKLGKNNARRLQRVMGIDERDVGLLSVRKKLAADACRMMGTTKQALTAYRVPVRQSGRALRLDEAR